MYHCTHERAIGETGERVSNVTSVVGETRVRTSDHRSRNHPLRHRRSRRQTFYQYVFSERGDAGLLRREVASCYVIHITLLRCVAGCRPCSTLAWAVVNALQRGGVLPLTSGVLGLTIVG
jgi:hypothetical protein